MTTMALKRDREREMERLLVINEFCLEYCWIVAMWLEVASMLGKLLGDGHNG